MNVSADALRTVKDALGTFKTDIKGIGSTANTHSQACLKSCREKLRKVAERINQLESKEAQLTLRIQQLDVKIESYQQKQNEIENRIPQTEYKIEGLYSQQETLMNRLNELQSRLSGTEDEDERAKIQAQIAQVQEQLNYVKNLLRETKEALSKLKEQKETILAEISRMSSEKNDNDSYFAD